MSATAAVVQAARDMLARGYAVVPTRLNKHPLGEGWRRIWPPDELEKALARPDIVGIGFLGGALSHNVVPIDFDTDEAEAWWRREHEAAGLDPDDYPTVLTPRPGRHRYVSDVRGTLGNAAGDLGDLGIDVRGRGQAVLPPSPHPNGGFYAWAPGRSFANFEAVPTCPDFVYDAILRVSAAPQAQPVRQRQDDAAYSYCRSALSNTRQRLGSAGKGARNTELNNSALGLAALAHYGAYTESEAQATLRAACEANGLMGEDGPRAFDQTFASGWKAGLRTPRIIPDRQQDSRRDNRAEPPTDGAPAPQLSPLPITLVSALAGKAPPPRPWCVPDWIPDQVMTLLAGDGGVGKSIAALQLHIACAVGALWLGLAVDPRPSLYFSAEDPFDEVHRRVFEIAAALGVGIETLNKFAFCAYADEDAVLMAPGDRFPVVLRPTEVWDRLVLTCDRIGARLVTIDTAADTFGGDEIKRREVRAFVSLMNRHARAIGGAVVMTSHPSLEGLRSGSGTSGSTGWNNSCRSRLYLTNPSAGDDNDEGESDPDARILTRKKANFARVGDSISMRWQAGVLVAIGEPGTLDRIALNAKADRVFLQILRDTYALGNWVSPNPLARNYAPARFGKLPDREDLNRAALEGAMHRLLKADAVMVETYGYQSNIHHRLALGTKA